MSASPLHSLPHPVAYFSMEIGLKPAVPNYSGGLGVLAGDMLRAAADDAIPLVGVTLLYRRGFFRQRIDEIGNQTENPSEWKPEHHLELQPQRATVTVEGRAVRLRAWRFSIEGLTGHVVPVFLLDSGDPENSEFDRGLTDNLYGGDQHYRLCQEAVLGMGGIAMLRALGYPELSAYHMNEGHSALLTLALLKECMGERGIAAPTEADADTVRRRCVFTTHTPVPAGHDIFPPDQVRKVLSEDERKALDSLGCCPGGALNMTYLGLYFSRYINGVSRRHEQISQDMFPNYPVNAVTNGVHAGTWMAQPLCDLFEQHIPEWRRDNRYLRYAVSIPVGEIWRAHNEAKRELLAEVTRRTDVRLDPKTMTVGFARRATPYKRADLLLRDLDRLRRIAREVGPLQILYAGKAHPSDEPGKDMIRRVSEAARALKDDVTVLYLENYDMAMGRFLCSGVDLWVNTPHKPQEASGTSGMKAAMNGIPSLSVLDGWWIEGHFEGVTGWAVGDGWESESDVWKESVSLYDKLEYLIVPMFYHRPMDYAEVMRSAIALNGSFFNAQRMISQYLLNAYSASH